MFSFLCIPHSFSFSRKAKLAKYANNNGNIKNLLSANKIIGFLVSILLLHGFLVQDLSAQQCSLGSLAETVSSPILELNVDCPGVPFFKLSESPDFQESADTGVIVSIDHIDPLGEYTDVSIRYPNGTAGENAIPFSVTETTREVRILAVLFNFSDGSLTPPSYATPEWVDKLVFSGDHDGRGLANSIKAHIEQNTYGTVQVSGEVYPEWVEISSIEKYRDFNITPAPDNQFADEIVTRLLETDPNFFIDKEFDFLIAFTPGGLYATTINEYGLYSNWPDPNGIFEGWAIFDIPIDSNSQVYDTIHDEDRVSSTNTIVIPRYNPYSVEGVWLSTDTGHTGTNFFTGGRVRYDTANPNHFVYFIELGTPLPQPETEVVISYYPRAYIRLTDEQMTVAAPDTLPETFNNGHIMHELYHGMGWLLTPHGQTIGDLYHNPQQLIEPFDLMASGAWNNVEIDGNRYYVPANLSAYSKVNLGILQPFTLQYGENEIGVRLYRAEEGDFENTNDKVKVIKVPLRPPTDIGFRKLVGYPEVEESFAGEEYLLLEWRYSGELENGAYNFDEALPDNGLIIYRAVEGDPYTHGNSYQNIMRVIDATPSTFAVNSLGDFRTEEVYSLFRSAAPFGDDSGVYEYIAAAGRNWKAEDFTTADFLLSPGTGQKTIYARFMDLNGEVVAESSAWVNFEEAQYTTPVADAGGDQTVYDDGDGFEWVHLDGGQSFDPGGSDLYYEWFDESGALIAEGVTPELSLEVGVHTITLVVYDDLGASGTSEVQVHVIAVALNPIADAGNDITVIDQDSDRVESVLLDGSDSYDEDGMLGRYDWYEDEVLIASGSSVSVFFDIGIHEITLKVTDNSGLVNSDSLVVEVLEGEITAPEKLSATVTGNQISLSWSDTVGNISGYYVEQGRKVKNTVQYIRVTVTGADVTTYSKTLPTGSYYFRVQAYGVNAVSEYSKPVQVRIKK